MCRLLGWNGTRVPLATPLLDAPHSLVTQSLASREAPVLRHGDGNGIAWYERGGVPVRVRSALPAWRDERLAHVARAHAASLALAHVRAATDGEATESNSHPFVEGALAFVHVGKVAGMDAIRDGLVDRLSPERRGRLRGDTDSEVLFALLVERGLDSRPADAYADVVALLAETQRAAGTERSVRLASLHSDGRSLYAYRYATDGEPPLLYRSSTFLPGTGIVASESLDDRSRGWTVVPPGRLWRISPRTMTAL